MKRIVTAWLAAAALSACTLMPHYQRPQSPVPDRWPADAGAPMTAASAAAPGVTPGRLRQRLRRSDRLEGLLHRSTPCSASIDIALENNRNLRIAVLNVAASEAQFRVQRGNLFPAISATGSGLAERLPANGALPLGGVGGSGGSSTGAERQRGHHLPLLHRRNRLHQLRARPLRPRAQPDDASLRAVSGAERDAAAARRSASSPRWPRTTSRCSPTRHS